MEPNNLNSFMPPDDAHLEAWLCEHTAQPPLADEGFTQSVLRNLPQKANHHPTTRQLAILSGAAVGSAIAAWSLFANRTGPVLAGALEREFFHAMELLVTPAMGLALTVTIASLLFVYWHELRRLAPW